MGRIRKAAGLAAAGTHKKTVWRIALYIRLSKDDGNDESLSVTNQKKILYEYIESCFQGEYTIDDEYVDDGASGTDYDRPDFQRMIHAIEAGNVNCIICKNLSRAFRNYSDQGYFLENFFPLHSTRFITLGDPKVDTYLNPEGVNGMEVPINGLMNDRFAYKTSSDVRRTFDTKRRKGEFIGAFAPYGYAKDPKDKNALVIDPEAAQVVKNIFQWFVYGDGGAEIATGPDGIQKKAGKGSLSKRGISRKLNELGIPNPSMYKTKKGLKYRNPYGQKNDGLWIAATVSRILKNKMYIGTMVQGRQKVISYKVHDTVNVPEEEWYQVEHTHEAIIPLELFEKAQEMQLKDTRSAPGKKEIYLFSGFLRCADCGMSMTRQANKGYVYYSCSTYKRKSKDRCSKHTKRLDHLEAAVLTTVQKQIELAVTISCVIDRIQKAPSVTTKSSRLERLLKTRKEDLGKIQRLITNLYLDWKNDDITYEQYRSMKLRFEEQEEQLKQAVEHIVEEMGESGRGLSSENTYLQNFLKNGNITGLSQGLLAELADTILVHKDGGLTIQFKFKDCFKAIGR